MDLLLILFLQSLRTISSSEITGMQNLIFQLLKLPPRPWDPSHRVEGQKLMVNIWVEISVRVQKGGVVELIVTLELRSQCSILRFPERIYFI